MERCNLHNRYFDQLCPDCVNALKAMATSNPQAGVSCPQWKQIGAALKSSAEFDAVAEHDDKAGATARELDQANAKLAACEKERDEAQYQFNLWKVTCDSHAVVLLAIGEALKKAGYNGDIELELDKLIAERDAALAALAQAQETINNLKDPTQS